MQTTSCARCGRIFDPSGAILTGDGPICGACEARRQVAEEASRSSSSMSPLAWGAISLFCNVLMIPSILAISGGLRELKELDAARRAGMPPDGAEDRRTRALFAILLGAFHPLLLVGLVVLVAATTMIGVLSAASRPTPDDSTYGLPAPEPSASEPEGLQHTVRYLRPEPIAPQLADHALVAAMTEQRAFLYVTAAWCPPCNAIAASAGDPQMIAAFRGTYIVEVDIDEIDADVLREAGFEVGTIPAWYGLDAQGRFDGRMITGAAWGDDVPENMAPPLDAFFHDR